MLVPFREAPGLEKVAAQVNLWVRRSTSTGTDGWADLYRLVKYECIAQ